MTIGPDFRHIPVTHKARPQARRFPYTGLVFIVYGVAVPLAACGVASLYNAAGYGALLRKTQFSDSLPRAPSWSNVMFGAGAPELALAAGLAGLLLWRRLWQGVEPIIPADLTRGALLGALYGLLTIPFGIFGLFLRTGPREIPILVRPLFALVVAVLGSVYSIAVPWVWGTVLLAGAIIGTISALAADYLKPRLRE
jgi:hypothetical protein